MCQLIRQRKHTWPTMKCGRYSSFRATKDTGIVVLPKTIVIGSELEKIAMEENVSAETHDDITKALFTSLEEGNLNAKQVELSNLRDRLGRTLLEYIIANHDLGALEILYAAYPQLYSRALLQSVDFEFEKGVIYLLENERRCSSMSDLTSEIINLDETYSQLKITPVLLAAQRNSITILERLLTSGINYIPVPHRVGCCCVSCSSARKSDCLRLSRFRLDVNRAKASEALLLLTETDPLTKAFQLAYEYRELSLIEVEFREEYLELAENLELFSCNFISFVWSSSEIESVMRFNDSNPIKRLDVLKKAVKYRQSK